MTTTPEREPNNEELELLAAEALLPQAPERDEELNFGDPLEDLYREAVVERKLRKPQRKTDPSLREALDAAAKKMREYYSDPGNWTRVRGVLLIDRKTQTILGNFSEYVHIHPQASGSRPRKWIREHSPIEVTAREEIEGFLGVEKDREINGVSWDAEKLVTTHVLLDEVQCEAPHLILKVCLLLSTVVRVELTGPVQFANASGNLLLALPEGTDIWPACGVDTKAAIRKAAL